MNVVGLDLGTSRVKAVRFDSAWHAVDSADEPTVVQVYPDGRREQVMHEVWAAAARVLHAVVSRSPQPVDLVAVTGQGDGCWLVDSRGEPVLPALLWNDNRAAGLVARWQHDGTLEQAFRISGSYGSPGLASAQLHWLREHRPDALTRGTSLLSCGSWVFSRLTGQRVLETSEAANPFLAAGGTDYDDRLLELFGLTGLRHLLPPVVRGRDRVAPLTDSSLGLPSGTPVCLAPYDVPATAIGVGAVAPGSAFAVLGTTLCVGTVSAEAQLGRTPGGMTLPAAADGTYLLAAASLAGTQVLDWAAGTLGLPDAAAVVRLAEHSTRTDLPTVLPYLSGAGERSPFLDPAVRGSVHGLDLGHSQADVARAVLEGLTMVIADCAEHVGAGAPLALCGGGARSEFWCRSISDATGRAVTTPDTAEVGARGAALSGAVDVGAYPDLGAAVAEAVHPAGAFEPDPARVEHLALRRRQFLDLREQERGPRRG